MAITRHRYRVERKQGSDVKVKASSMCLADRTSQTAGLFLHAAHIQELNFWNFLPFRYVSWRENEYDMARGEYFYAKVMMKLAYNEARLSVNTEIKNSDRYVKRGGGEEDHHALGSGV